MALIFMDGFDKYGAASTSTTVVANLLQTEWTNANVVTIVAPLSATGNAVALNNAGVVLTKNFGSNYARLIGGFRFSCGLGNAVTGVQFLDGASNQSGFQILTTGAFQVRNASFSGGTILATSTATVLANATHYVEFDFTFSNTGAYQIWLDGVSIISGTGDLTGTANNYANGFSLSAAASSALTVDDFYLFDTSGSTNNAALLTSPRIETQFPISDSSAQFGIGAAILGTSVQRSNVVQSTVANQIRARAFTPARNCTVNSVSFLPNATSSTVNLRPVIYTDSAGAPSSLMSAGSTVTGQTAGAAVTMPLTTPQALTAGTLYWLGFMCDIAVTNALATLDGSTTSDRTGTATFTSGAPGTYPTTSAATTTMIWGNISGTGANYFEVNQNPAQGTYSNVTDTTVGHEDLYNFPNLSITPTSIYAVALKANCARSDTGARTVSMRMNSAGTDSGGTATGQTPGTTYGWLTTLFETDPHTSAAWLPANLNSATSGIRIDA